MNAENTLLAERKQAILDKITNWQEKYHYRQIFRRVIDALAHDVDPVLIIDQLIDININLSEQLEKRVISEPLRCEITGEGAKELAKYMSRLEWQPVDPESLPTGEVLARDKNNAVLVG